MSTTTSPLERNRPIVLVPACSKPIGHHAFHVAGRKYVDAVRLAGCLPLVVPAAAPQEVGALLAIADGVLLTGSASNVHPRHFGEAVHDTALPLDEARDTWTLPLIRETLRRGMPLLGICRGLQETNVALGGALHQAVQEQPGLADHRSRDADPVEVQYGPAHVVHVQRGGVLEAVLGPADFQVNSLHGQGIARLADGLRVEARAPDGLIEAFSDPRSSGFNLCVQWHPEWQAADNPVSRQLLAAFGQACRRWRDARSPHADHVPET
ncbi:gamma-glutamyl-gamma-aminobutyrate hydrolase family protein [Pseudorhodoferax sp. Leaf267]|uniref:gamma-glutamyl-gamma-aminobutyrate hydrolase family protein n=1 Tax=Pseudorhodoferax sp. Leaf267 TaxID=1736316 RepID=UPI00070167B4|nr:gamma-glutamyl-gamma-aminobutyrate hydrolase family protein [Pseudorhodoferax sp. Leaf267]KQP21488.1 gamma-glutamyl-gamma-aminobutyrate hydrolase [Pseudorhodoferax sp. Leaf267]